jgi:hypothetical protein
VRGVERLLDALPDAERQRPGEFRSTRRDRRRTPRLVRGEQLAHHRSHPRLAQQAVRPARRLVDRRQDRSEVVRDAVRETQPGFAAERLVGEVGTAGAGLGPGHERDADIGPERVRLPGEHRVVVARGVERHGRALVEQAAAGCRGERGEAGVDHEEQAAAAQMAGIAAQRLALTHHRDRPGRKCPDTHQGVDGFRPADAVGLESPFALESAQPGVGLGSEDAVLPAGVEPERVEPALQLAHVVAAQHRRAHVEEPIAERPAALDQRAPRLGAADAVDAQAAARLELAHARAGLFTELTIERDRAAALREARLKVANRVARVADAQERR